MQEIQFSEKSLLKASEGRKIFVNKAGYDSVSDWMIRNKIIYEHHLLMILSPILRDAKCMIDIGSHIGVYGYTARLLGNNRPILFIDANKFNLDLAKINQGQFPDTENYYLLGFWDEKSEQDLLYCESAANASHDVLYKSISKERTSASQQPISIIKNKDILDFIEKVNTYPSQAEGSIFLKIDVDGGEDLNAAQLVSSMVKVEKNIFALVETGNPETVKDIASKGMMITALLPGNNFLFTSKYSQYSPIINEVLSLSCGFFNFLVDDPCFIDYIESQNYFFDKSKFTIQTRYGRHHFQGKLMHKNWVKLLGNVNIPTLSFG